ncbi:MAG TPA: glycosyltransferase 87 family protein, partial [Polyangiales bacterium]|nr:glycosyltransferase 87 family protein [Polyangiales bacterium]
MLTPHRLRPHIDLYPAYVAARLANEGRWDRIYHSTIWLHDGVDPEWDKRAADLTKDQLHGTSFVYHPWYLQVMRPIAAYTTYPQFQQGSVLFNQFCIVLAGLAIAILLGASTLPVQVLVTLLLGKATTTIYGLEFGQNVMPALMFALAAAVTWRSRMPLWLGGSFAALAWICKPWCSLLLILCFALRGVRAGLVTSLALAFAMILLPDLVMPSQLMRDYKAMTLALTNVSVSGYNNFSILVTLERLFQPDWGRHVLEWLPRAPEPAYRAAALASAAAVFLVGFALWWWRKPATSYTIAAVLAALLLPLGITWTHYFAFAIPLACLCTFDPKAPAALRVIGVVLLAELIGLAEYAGIPNDRFGQFFSNPPRYPWRQALPIILVIVAVIAALALAPR